MKRSVEKLSEAAVKQRYPLSGDVAGWFFRIGEVSNGGYVVEGTDLWGRTVSRMGGDPDALLALCVADARDIEAQRARQLAASDAGPEGPPPASEQSNDR